MSRNLEDGLARLRALLAHGADRALGGASTSAVREREGISETTPVSELARAASAKRNEYNF